MMQIGDVTESDQISKYSRANGSQVSHSQRRELELWRGMKLK
jgi:hypothetical protein